MCPSTSLIAYLRVSKREPNSSAVSSLARYIVLCVRQGCDPRLLCPSGHAREVFKVPHLLGVIPNFVQLFRSLRRRPGASSWQGLCSRLQAFELRQMEITVYLHAPQDGNVRISVLSLVLEQ